MIGEELERLLTEISGQLEGLVETPEKPLDRKERRKKVLLEARKDALERARAAREKGEVNKEMRACLDYSLLTEYGEKHPFFFNFVRAQVGWGSWW